MGNKPTEDSDIERTPEYVNFIRTLEAYHAQRGTHFVREPALGPRRISLLKLYKRIIAMGGYDMVSDTPMMWKKIAAEYNVPPMSNAGMPGYLLKTMYYKNLAAFEIETHWKRQAPPPERLESLTARGGAIMRRPNVLNPPSPKSPMTATNSHLPAHHAQRPRPTPAQRSSAQQQLMATQQMSQQQQFSYLQQQQQQQPQPQPQQQQPSYGTRTRLPATPTPAAQPRTITPAEAAWFERDGPFIKPLMPITAGQFATQTLQPEQKAGLQPFISRYIELRPVPEKLEGRLSAQQLSRIALALKSGITAEMGWALKQLTRASYEQGDDLVLERTPGLAETLMEVLFDGVQALISTDADSKHPAKRIKRKSTYYTQREQGKAPFFLEAALILRNASLQTDNAKYIGRLPQATQIYQDVLAMPVNSATIELRQYCLDMIELGVQVLGIYTEDHPVYRSIASLLISTDRHDLLFSLRVLAKLSFFDEHNRVLQDIKPATINRLTQLLFSSDDELVVAIVEFLYHFSTYKHNTKALAENQETPILLRQLLSLTRHGDMTKVDTLSKPQASKRATAPADVPMLPEEVVQELCQFAEPERAIHWMQTCYQAATSDDDVTQISLWTAYRTRFGASVTKERPLLQAADLIKMVNTAFPTATAMVMQGPDGQRFIIRGIRPRESPVTPSGKVYTACKWMVPAPEATALNGAVPSQQNGTQASQLVPCAHQCVDAKTLYEHILQAHVPKDGAAISTCWQGCTKYAARAETDTNKVALHARVHLPKAKAKQATSTRTSLSVQLRYTAHDDKGEARGVALLATAILKNLAKAEPALFQGADVSPFLFEQALMTNLAVNPVLAAQSAETLCQLAR